MCLNLEVFCCLLDSIASNKLGLNVHRRSRHNCAWVKFCKWPTIKLIYIYTYIYNTATQNFLSCEPIHENFHIGKITCYTVLSTIVLNDTYVYKIYTCVCIRMSLSVVVIWSHLLGSIFSWLNSLCRSSQS